MPDPASDGVADSAPAPVPCAHPDGHFYSPVVDVHELAARQQQVWPAHPDVRGIDFNEASHRAVLEQWFPRYLPGYDYPEHAPTDDTELTGFYTRNSQFSWLDARALFVLMQAWQPQRIIEVGSGYSSLLMADVNLRHLDNACHVTCIEPYPRPFLTRGLPGLAELVQEKVQDVPLERFEALAPGDILFIDSSHVAKTGSDVNHLFFEVLPRLAAGVRVHVHDIFLPHDYPQEWALTDNRSWNEQYLLRALLMHTHGWRVLFGCNYAWWRFPDAVRRSLAHPAGIGYGGGSFWMERA